MTREEAKEILTHNWTRVDNPNYSESELDEAFFMAIEALSLANLKEEFESAEAEQGVGRYENAMQKLREMPRYLNGVKEKQITKISADAVQGKWIIHGEPPWLVRECSECGTKWHQWSGDKTPNYCGNCGSRMKGADNEID